MAQKKHTPEQIIRLPDERETSSSSGSWVPPRDVGD